MFLTFKKIQIIFLIYSQTSNLIATLEVEKRHREGQKSDRKRTASTAENDHQPKKVYIYEFRKVISSEQNAEAI